MVSRKLSWLIATMIVVAGALALFAAGWATQQARDSTDASARATAGAHVGLLSSELQKFRLLPLVLVDYPDVARALSGNAESTARLDRTLELFAARTDAAAIYAIDRNGRAVAASNWRQPASFVGQEYGFRPYFTEAMRRGSSEHFALGTVSGRPGLYLARRVDVAGRPAGGVVVKVEFDRVEATWARASGSSIVTDGNGVVLVTSVPGWRFRPTRPLDDATLADARRTRQFGATPPTAAPFTITGAEVTVRENGRLVRYRVASVPVPVAGAHLLHLAPLDPALAAARSRALLWALGALLIIGATGVMTLRSTDKRRLQRAAQDALEHEVARRTAELSAANAQLTIESAERLAADLRYRDAREELAQANRLGSIGQITAGVAHEINQPVAAIRTFAESGSLLLERGRIDIARENLTHIVGLTERIGAITAELRAFARRKTPATGETEIGAVLDGLLLLIGDRGRRALELRVPPACRATRIVGDRIRIEQVLVNLVTNALDAVKGQGDGQVVLTAVASDPVVTLSVSDNGPGIDPTLVDSLFSPFVSSKPEGLGLGLAIAQNIAREFGGDLVLAPRTTGTEFVVTLQRA